jgi:hypothetical protein
MKVNLGTRCSLKMSKNMNKRTTKRKSAPENSILNRPLQQLFFKLVPLGK